MTLGDAWYAISWVLYPLLAVMVILIIVQELS